MINIKSAYSDESFSFPQKFSLGISGEAIDDRTRYSSEYLRESCDSRLKIKYQKGLLNLIVNDQEIECHELSEFIANLNPTSTLVDATSLDIPELSLTLKSLHQKRGRNIFITYVEPAEYSSAPSSTLDQEEFSLSEEITGFEGTGIPTISMPVDSELARRFLFFVGFEGGRLQNAIETFDISSDEIRVFFGMPAFRPGWEIKSIRRNLHALSDQSFSSQIGYCCASSCSDALRSLSRASSLSPDTINYVVPLGTKPNSIAAILHMLENPVSTRLLYDQPHKKSERSRGVGRRHFYNYLVP